MKKVLIIAQGGLNRGGIQTVIMNYLRCLHNTYSFDIVVFSKDKRDYDCVIGFLTPLQNFYALQKGIST